MRFQRKKHIACHLSFLINYKREGEEKKEEVFSIKEKSSSNQRIQRTDARSSSISKRLWHLFLYSLVKVVGSHWHILVTVLSFLISYENMSVNGFQLPSDKMTDANSGFFSWNSIGEQCFHSVNSSPRIEFHQEKHPLASVFQENWIISKGQMPTVDSSRGTLFLLNHLWKE